jgi:outer membrane lipoprotein-sorting protein
VQWAVLDKDPVPGYRDRIKRMQGLYQTQLGQAKNEAQKEMARSALMTVNWDFGFRDVTGDQLYMLTGPPEKPHGFSSNSPAGKKWIVTKTVHIKGKPVCWCLPVEMKPGEPIKLTLTEDNVFDLGASMDEALGAEKKTEDNPKAEPEKDKGPSLINAPEKTPQGPGAAFQDEPDAHALYNRMVEAMRKANSLSYVSRYTWESKGLTLGDCYYRVWLKKPNYFRVETEIPAKSPLEKQVGKLTDLLRSIVSAPKVETSVPKKGGILIGDGNILWIYWPEGRPQFVRRDEETEADRKSRLSSYMMKPAPLAMHSIGHEVCYLGAPMSMPVIDPSTFHGYTDSLQPYLDGVKSLGEEKVGDEECEKIELSIMKHQRSWFLWLSKNDHLPRKLQQIVRVSHDIIMNEEWSSVTVNADIPDSLFTWKPPEGWTEWKMPKPEDRLLKPGTKAPDFDLASADGSQIKFSDYRGKIVWLYIWRAG